MFVTLQGALLGAEPVLCCHLVAGGGMDGVLWSASPPTLLSPMYALSPPPSSLVPLGLSLGKVIRSILRFTPSSLGAIYHRHRHVLQSVDAVKHVPDVSTLISALCVRAVARGFPWAVHRPTTTVRTWLGARLGTNKQRPLVHSTTDTHRGNENDKRLDASLVIAFPSTP